MLQAYSVLPIMLSNTNYRWPYSGIGERIAERLIALLTK